MNAPHLFVWSGGVINLDRVIYASVTHTPSAVEEEKIEMMLDVILSREDQGISMGVTLHGEDVGRFMNHCAQFHAGFSKEDLFPKGGKP